MSQVINAGTALPGAWVMALSCFMKNTLTLPRRKMIMSEKRDAYVREMKAKLGELNGEINKFKAKVVDASAEKKAVYNDQLEKLKEKREHLEEKITSLQEAGDSTWENLKHGVEESWESLKESFASAKDKVKGE
ncbi:MAG: hypothetical protein ABR542_10825 [Desulfonatronovibrio sp.]